MVSASFNYFKTALVRYTFAKYTSKYFLAFYNSYSQYTLTPEADFSCYAAGKPSVQL